MILGNMLGHVRQVFQGVSKGYLIVLGKVFRGSQTYKKPTKITETYENIKHKHIAQGQL